MHVVTEIRVKAPLGFRRDIICCRGVRQRQILLGRRTTATADLKDMPWSDPGDRPAGVITNDNDRPARCQALFDKVAYASGNRHHLTRK